jgi:hypothetical protein
MSLSEGSSSSFVIPGSAFESASRESSSSLNVEQLLNIDMDAVRSSERTLFSYGLGGEWSKLMNGCNRVIAASDMKKTTDPRIIKHLTPFAIEVVQTEPTDVKTEPRKESTDVKT